MKYLILLISVQFFIGCATTDESNYEMKKINKYAELIVLASPNEDDEYYNKYAEEILNFHINFAKQIIANGDQVMILSSNDKIKDYQQAVPEAAIVNLAMDDIWMRDFSLSNLNDPIKFRYSAAGQGGGAKGQIDSDAVQSSLFTEIKEAGLVFKTTSLINDGGNWVDNGLDKVIISNKFLKDNNLTESAAEARLKKDFNMNAVFIEADEQGGLEHSDGIVSFIEPNKLIINSYPEDKNYMSELKKKIKNKFQDVEILEIPTPYDGSKIHDTKFGSACGLYTNALVTLQNIYLPQFGIPEDAVVLKMISKFTNKNIVPVQSSGVCQMGGGVRCMSWQLNGINKDKLLKYLIN